MGVGDGRGLEDESNKRLCSDPLWWVVGWCDAAGYTSSAGASYNLDTVGQGPTALAVGADGGCLDIFTLLYPFSPLSPSLGDGSI